MNGNLVVYDSLFGNTERVAKAIGKAINARVAYVKSIDASELQNYHFLIFGAPTQGGRPKSELEEFLRALPKDALKGMKVAAFDTRIPENEQQAGLRFLMKLIDYAAPKIAIALEKKGGKLVGEPEGFIVEDKEGPLRKGELKRAAEWVKKLV